MANHSLTLSHHIDQDALEQVRLKISYTFATLHMFSGWLEDITPGNVNPEEAGRLQYVIWMLTDLMKEAQELLPQP